MRRIRKTIKIIGWLIIALVVLILLLSAGTWGALQLDAVREYLRVTIVKQMEKSLHQQVELSPLKGQLPFHISFDHFSIRDDQGVWLSIDHFKFDFQASELLKGHVHLQRLSAESIRLMRIPEQASKEQQREPRKKEEGKKSVWHVPAFLAHVSLDKIAVSQLILGEELLGTPIEWSVVFAADFQVDKDLRVHADVKRLDGLLDDLMMDFRLTNGLSQGAVSMQFNEGADGIFSHFLGPGYNPISVSVHGQGAITNWRGRIQARCGAVSNRVSALGRYCFDGRDQFLLDWSVRQDVLPGRVTGGVQVYGPLDRPVLDMFATVQHLQLSQLAQLNMKPLDVMLRAGMYNSHLNATLITTGSEYCAINGKAVIPAEMKLNPFIFDLGKDSPIDGHLSATVNLAVAAPILQTFMQNIKGILNADIALAGTLGAPDLKGYIRMDDGLYENLKVGAVLRNIDANIAMEQDELIINNFSADDAATGKIRLSGGVDFTPQEHQDPVRLRVTMTNAQLVSQTMLDVSVDADIALNGNHTHLDLVGTSVLNRVSVNLQEALPPDVTDVEVVEINKPGQRENTKPEKKKEPAAAKHVDLNLTVKSDGKVFVKGRGLDSEWRTGIHVGGTAQIPKVTGSLSLVRGFFVFLGKRLELEQCSVTFDGGWPVVPQIDIRASTTTSELIAYLRVYGPATSPQIELRSEPSRPQDEILSMMLFGKKPDELSATEALKIAYGINVLRGGTSSDGILSRAQRTLGVDQMGIRQGNNEQTQFAVGKYIGKYIYIEGEKSLQGEGDAVKVDVNLTRSLQLNTKASSEEGEGQSVYLRWHRDY